MKKKMSEEELNNIPKDMIIKMYVQLSDSFDLMNSQMDELNKNLALMKEQIAILTQNRFGRKTEKSADIPSGQMTIMDILPEDMRDVFNEAEATAEEAVEEVAKEAEEVKVEETLAKATERIEALEADLADKDTKIAELEAELAEYKASESTVNEQLTKLEKLLTKSNPTVETQGEEKKEEPFSRFGRKRFGGQ